MLHKKSELKQAFENRHMSQVKKAKEEEIKASKNEIQLKLEEQAEKLRLVTVIPMKIVEFYFTLLPSL